ncbi:Phosphoserine phosphatase 1 [compost metagenome]
MKIIIVRHGESMGDIEQRYEGKSEFELSLRGHLQAECLSKWLAETQSITTIITSPLRRAVQTAEYISNTTKAPIIFEELLSEIDLGYVTGLPKEEGDRLYPVPDGGFKHDTNRGVIGESELELRIRCNKFLEILVETQPMEARLCIISHGHFISTLHQCFTNQPPQIAKGYTTGDTGVHLWDLRK